ncbi:MAG TPA: Rne/Rng family ribonuclease [Actinomycetota bacterium]|nr:Rne/Rng family ribonuclease [Actinomycetota bacterium]
MDHDIDVEGRAASVTPTPEEGTSTTSPAERAPTRTSASRRRRRGGRGRGRGRSGAAAASGTSDGSGDVATTPAEPSEGSASVRAEADASSEPDRPAETGGTSKPKSPQRSGQPRRRKPAGSTATTPTTGDPSETTGSPQPPVSDDGAEPAQTEAQADGATTAVKKRRRRRGGRGRSRKPAGAAPADADADDAPVIDPVDAQRDEAEPDADAAAKPPARRRRRSSASRADDPQRTTKAPTGLTAATEPAAPQPARSRPAKAKTIEEQVAAGGPTRGIRTTRSRTGREGRRRQPQPTPPRVTDKLMVITERGDRDQIAVLEEDVLVQHYVTRAGATSMVGNIYLGRVQNVLPGMEAAFVDVGRGRNGVLYAGEVNYSPEDIEGAAPRIEQLLKPGQAVMVQVTKDPMGGKGARLTANLSLAGRYLVLAPNQDLQGISRRLPDEARKRLKTLLKRVKPPEHGVIVRTAAESATEEALEADLRRLLAIWDQIRSKATRGKAPTVLYEEPELTVRVVRDLFTDEEYRGLVTDSQRVYGLVVDYVREVAPDLAEKVTLHTGPLPAFEAYRIVEQIHKALDRKVWLPSGGYLIIERTEAMTIVDVNTGKSVGKTNLEATVVNTNLEAAREVARQLRLRDIGGIIVIDFIDMLLEKNKKQVEDTMRDALAIDKTRSQVFEIGPLGLMQVTRKRVSSGLVESFSQICPTCEGRGIILTYDVD